MVRIRQRLGTAPPTLGHVFVGPLAACQCRCLCLSAPLTFFNPPPAFPEQPAQAPLVDAMGLTATAGLGWRQPREQELLGENS